MGICNLKNINNYLQSRKAVFDRYCKHLNNIEGIVLNKVQENVISNYAYFPVYFDKAKFGKSRDDVFVALREHEIYARKYFYPAVNEMNCYKDTANQDTPVAHDASMNILTLPIYDGLSMEEVDKICEIILS